MVGDTEAGKSALIHCYLNNSFLEEYWPTVLEVHRGTKSVNKRQIDIEMHDTSGDEDMAYNRKTVYDKASLFILCVAKDGSLNSIDKWVKEIN